MKKWMVCMLLLLTGTICGCQMGHHQINATNFQKTMKEYSVSDISDQYYIYENIEKAYGAVQDTKEIKFYQFKTEKDAQKMYQADSKNITADAKNKKIEKKKNYKNTQAEQNKIYYRSTQIGNTVITGKGTSKDKEAIDHAFKELGY